MLFLQANGNTTGITSVMFLGTLGMLTLAIAIVCFVIFHQRKIIRYNNKLKRLEEEKQQILLNASIRFQEEERNRIAADLHASTRKAVMSSRPPLAPVRAYTSMMAPSIPAPSQYTFCPLSTQPPDVRVARALSAAMLDPTSGSLTAIESRRAPDIT